MGFAPKFQTKRLILVVGLVFSVFIVLQSLSLLPYRAALLSILVTSNKSAIVEQSTPLVHNSNSTERIDVRKEIKKDNEAKGNENSQLEEDQTDSEESAVQNAAFLDHNFALGESMEPEQGLSAEEVRKSDNEDTSLTLRNVPSAEAGFVSQPLQTDPTTSKEATKALSKSKSDAPLQTDLVNLTKNSTITSVVSEGNGMLGPISISKMTSLLLQNRLSSRAKRPRWSSVRDQELLLVKSQIESAPRVKRDPLYRNVSMFKRSYELMEKMLKVYIYKEGENPVFHQPKLKGIYASEGWFMKLMEGNKHFVVEDPTKAHIFYLPFSIHRLRSTFNRNSHHHKDLAGFLKNYVDVIAGKYPFWNRTGGADHFFAACHDWAPQETIKYLGTCIRALCNADVANAFKLGKDVSLPVTMVRFLDDPLRSLGGRPPSKRPFLAFFAGSLHGYVRPILLHYWENKDTDMKIFGPLPRHAKPKYLEYMKSSKYCICARGYAVHTPRVVEAIFHECVPVIISDNYVPPFFEILNWEAFSVFILEKDIPNLKKILLSIPKKRYLELQKRVKMVQKHFLWHENPVKHDIFHMTLHSIWYNRVFQIKPR